MIFKNREDAAYQLSERLRRYGDEKPMILAIPRGAVPMARIIADQLQGDLNVVLVHKIGAPGIPEFAIGSVTEFGDVYVSKAAEIYNIPKAYIRETAKNELEILKRRRQLYKPLLAFNDLKGRTAIIVDDGLATGSTMLAAVRTIREVNPRKIVVAVPVASQEAVELLSQHVDDLVVLDVPEYFGAVGNFYEEFSQLTEDEVIHLLTMKDSTRKTA